MVIEDSYALLAPLSGNGERPDVLLTDDGRFEARADALVDGGNMAMLGIGIRHDRARALGHRLHRSARRDGDVRHRR